MYLFEWLQIEDMLQLLNSNKYFILMNASKLTAACCELADMKQYSRIVADSICDSRILSEIRGYFL